MGSPIFSKTEQAAIIKAIWKNLEKKGELFMLNILQTGKALYVLAAIGAIGVLSKLVTQSLYKRLIHETDNMAMTKNRNLKILKQKLENACRLNQNIVNTEAYLERQMYSFQFMRISLQSWNNVSIQMTILGIMAGGAASFASYWYRLDSYYIVLYASAGAFLGLTLVFLDSSFNIGLKHQRLANALLEYTDNSVFVRAYRDSLTRSDRLQDNVRRIPVREISRENLEERERVIRENDLRDGLIRETAKTSPQTRGQASQDKLSILPDNRRNKPAGLKRLKAEKMSKPKKSTPVPASIPGRLDEGASAAFSGKNPSDEKKMRKDLKVSDGVSAVQGSEEKREDSVRDIDYLKHSLEQIAASREKSKNEEEWAKDLNPEEMKVLGALLRHYLSTD